MEPSHFLNMIVAVDKKLGIGWEGKIPWHVTEDMKRFKRITKDSILIMGRKTWESIPEKHRTFPERLAIIVVSKSLFSTYKTTVKDFVQYAKNLSEGIAKAWKVANHSISEAKRIQEAKKAFPKAFICGGAQLYKETLTHFSHLLQSVQITGIPGSYLTDTRFPLKEIEKMLPTAFYLKQEIEKLEKPHVFLFTESTFREMDLESNLVLRDERNYMFPFHRDNPDQPYVDVIERIFYQGEERPDRTGVGTYSVFDERIVFDLQEGFPLLSRRQIFWRGVCEETLFFLRGENDTKKLEEKGVNIWKGNTSREFLDARGLQDLPEGSFGEAYGWQWRHFGKPFHPHSQTDQREEKCQFYNNLQSNPEMDKEDEGIDQIQNVFESLRDDPYGRRHIVTAWNPSRLQYMALPPCHMLFQFYVRKKTYLDCRIFQRSCDVMLGLPFNIASYALITHIFAHKLGLKAGKLSLLLGDTHIYKNHMEGALEFMERPCLRFPTLHLTCEKDVKWEDITLEHIVLDEYGSLPKITMEMAV